MKSTIQIFLAAISILLGASASLGGALQSGHYVSEAGGCAYNVENSGDIYIAELSMWRAGVCPGIGSVVHVLPAPDANATYEYFKSADIKTVWAVISGKAFISYEMTRQSDGKWAKGAESMFRHYDECLQ